MPEHPWHPRFTAAYDEKFYAARRALGLSGTNFNHFFRDVEGTILEYPWLNAVEVPESGGTLMRETRAAFPDVPPLYVYYKVNREQNRIRFVSLSPAWSADETV
jgi:hypothetical protein